MPQPGMPLRTTEQLRQARKGIFSPERRRAHGPSSGEKAETVGCERRMVHSSPCFRWNLRPHADCVPFAWGDVCAELRVFDETCQVRSDCGLSEESLSPTSEEGCEVGGDNHASWPCEASKVAKVSWVFA